MNPYRKRLIDLHIELSVCCTQTYRLSRHIPYLKNQLWDAMRKPREQWRKRCMAVCGRTFIDSEVIFSSGFFFMSVKYRHPKFGEQLVSCTEERSSAVLATLAKMLKGHR